MPAHRTTHLDLTPAMRRCVDALDAHKGNRTAAADALGMDQRSFRRRLAEAVERGADLPEPAEAPARKPRRIEVNLADLVILPHLQPRVKPNRKAVKEYAEIYREGGGSAMDAIRAYIGDDGKPVLTRGFTRVEAAQAAELTTLPCDLYPPATESDMLLDSLGGNRHGHRLTNDDKQRALTLYHERIPRRKWGSTRAVRELIGCSHELVADFRRRLKAGEGEGDGDGGEGSDPVRTLAERRLERERELICQRILEAPGDVAPGSPREFALLLLIVGVDSDPQAAWNDDQLADSMARRDAAIAARVTTEIRAGNPRLPDLASIARLWQIDADAIRIQAQRAVPS